jgi:NAD+ synthase
MEDAVELARSLGMKYSIIEINRIVGQIFRGFPWRRFSPSERKTAMTNVKPRVRMIYDYIISNLDGRIVLGTTNKTEMLLGYFTKHGDGACDLEPLGCLYKTQVMQLAHFVGVPAHIIHKTPSAGLWVGQTDESEIGMSYGEMDSILSCIHDRKMTLQQAVRETGLSRSKVERISGLVKGSSHKRMMPPVIEI